MNDYENKSIAYKNVCIFYIHNNTTKCMKIHLSNEFYTEGGL
ncbi:hypothetical protein EMIT079MI2_40086 [Bacillus sp. IT-79MI2]